jgi:hypothetical protein
MSVPVFRGRFYLLGYSSARGLMWGSLRRLILAWLGSGSLSN